MRVSSNQYHITVNASLQNSNTQLEKLMGQMSSGNRLTRPSDDPIAHVRISRLQREEASIAQYKDNIGALSNRMTQSETVLSSINSDLLSTRDLLVWALDGGNTGEDLSAMATNLESLRDALYASALTKDQEGSYLFSGTLSKTATVGFNAAAAAGARYTVGGNSEQQQVVVGNGLTQPANVTLGDEMAAMLNTLDQAIEAIKGGGTTANNPATRASLQAALTGVDTGMDQVSTKISKLGGAQNIVSTLETNWGNLSTANQTAVLDYSQLNYATAAVQLNTLMSAIKATQSAYGKVSQLSLFDAL
ncbi:flagellar hook-associated protein FlgL [Comamonas terrigena]|jgi:flagellar hook-associated protein 3 FlgL|uniref:flagellar hook-associated protein FlgL n=1 Tax=Comamonas terrigena TaxID=32013 RepID=UPI0024473149|nr:flagellar hook-associated protein FlgL [Comamonas terrigena]MDH0049123.1 flagellar hook-associated protein FlgL [Comamonas terrigena]MDH0512088.1 flagellar hook-associated protein FlgL [Comamonas terrigena]MDH1091534.1 flagellar hook-associated protein FlgL [Comamonas terrigena]MDH1500485.1 flagellar hook-associated protein FlgL [Comamonas terrigena]